MFKRPVLSIIEKRITEPRRFMQVIVGPRQTGRIAVKLPGMDAFAKIFPVKKKLLIGSQGMDLHDFFLMPPAQWLAGISS